MNFILPHSFELDLRRECHYLVHRSFSFRVIQIRRSVQKFSSLGSPSADLFEREGFYFTDCSIIRFIDAQERLLLLCFYTGEASRLWWASVLLLSEPRQSVRTVRVPYRPSVFAPFYLKSAGLALIWASAVLLWFLVRNGKRWNPCAIATWIRLTYCWAVIVISFCSKNQRYTPSDI